MQPAMLAAVPTPSIGLALLGMTAIVAAGSWVAGHPSRVVAIGGRWRSPTWVAWVRDCLGGTGWAGALAASALILVIGVSLLVLVSWALGMLTTTGPVMRLDRPLYDWFVERRAGWLTAPMSVVTQLGSYTVTMLLAVVAGVGLAMRRRDALPLLLLVTVPVERYLQQAVASLVQAPVPPAALSIGPPGTFPSGGSARVVLVCGMVAWLLARHSVGWRPAVAGWTVAALLAFAEGYSRLYLGRHWVVDVLGGWVFGASLLAVLLATATLIPLPSRHEVFPPGSERTGWPREAGTHDRA
jgi:membrane-associated phospholipid phosphatase